MDYIDSLRQLNITFKKIKEAEAITIFTEEVSYFRIQCLTNAFERYRQSEKKGQFVNLDFAQLYYLSQIDEYLSHVLIIICLEIEKKLKIILLNDAYKVNFTCDFLLEFFDANQEYIKGYPDDLQNLLYATDSNPYSILGKFMDLASFGLFINFFEAFYKKYSLLIYERTNYGIEKFLDSVRNIRNKVAHNILLFDNIRDKNKSTNSPIYSYLSKHGLSSKTLHTNLSHAVTFDICRTLHLFCLIQSKKEIHSASIEMRVFIKKWKRCKKYFRKCDSILSTMNFLVKGAKIYSSKVTF